MTGARQTIAVIINFKKSNKNSLERRAGAYRSSRKKTTYITKVVFAFISKLSFMYHSGVSHVKIVSVLLTPMILPRPLRSSMEKAVMFLASSRARSLRSTLSSSSSQMAGTTLDRYRNTLGQNLSQTAHYRQTDSRSRCLYLSRKYTHPTKLRTFHLLYVSRWQLYNNKTLAVY